MVGELPADTLLQVLETLGSVALWLQALGVIVLIYIIWSFVSYFQNRKRLKELYKIKGDMHRIEEKIDRIEQKTDRILKKK